VANLVGALSLAVTDRVEDKRAVAVALTPAGRRVARNVAHARAATLEAALDPPTAEERSLFGELAGRILAGMVRRQGRAAGCAGCVIRTRAVDVTGIVRLQTLLVLW
jgi:hypothetical protein